MHQTPSQAARHYRPPPHNSFKPAVDVRWAHPSQTPPPFINLDRKQSGRRAEGIRYERKVHDKLRSRYPVYFDGQWFRFSSVYPNGARWCQCDGLIIDPKAGCITIIECKYQHTFDAWYQLFQLYLPVVQVAFGPMWAVSCCEVVKWYDPAVAGEPRPTLVASPDLARPGQFAVHILKP